jgi:hypothetical protein
VRALAALLAMKSLPPSTLRANRSGAEANVNARLMATAAASIAQPHPWLLQGVDLDSMAGTRCSRGEAESP